MSKRPNILLASAADAQIRGQFEQAESICRDILREEPDYAEAWHLLGILSQQQSRPAEAVKYIAEATKRDPKNARYWNNLGQAMRSNGQLPEAESSFRRAIEREPNSPLAWVNLSLVLCQMTRSSEAVAPARRAIGLQRDLASAHAALGQALSRDVPQAALEAFKQALYLDENQPDALNNVGALLMDMGHYSDALAAFEQAVTLVPAFPLAWNNLGIALTRMNRGKEALAAFERAIAMNPDFIAAHTNRATAWMLLGDLERGWKEYEWRWAAPPTPESVPRVLNKPLPPINREADLTDKTVLIYAEQGYGDIIHFIRYAALLAQRGAKIILSEVPDPVVSIVQSVQGIVRVEPRGGAKPAELAKLSDYQINLMSLPMLFGTTLATIPSQVPYLAPPPDRVRHWRQRLGDTKKMKIGLRWAGNPSHTNDFSRTIPPKYLFPLLAKPNAQFYSLQTERLELLHENLTDFTSDLTDFSETAALIANLDLVISVDTAVLHLSGALAKTTWALIPFGPEFRWLQNRADSPWYPTMRLFRQQSLHDWAGSIESVVAAL